MLTTREAIVLPLSTVTGAGVTVEVEVSSAIAILASQFDIRSKGTNW